MEHEETMRPLALLAGIGVSTLLLLSWFVFDPTRALWQKANEFIFFTCNGWIAENHAAQVAWGIANHRLFDIVAGSMIVLIFTLWIRSGVREKASGRIAMFLVYFITMAAAVMTGKTFAAENISPSGVLTPAYHLSQMLGWPDFWTPKDYSRVSFPGDHGMALFLAVFFLWAVAGRKYGVPMLVLAIIFATPRLVSGAHWLTDIAVGSIALAALFGSLVLFTPLKNILQRLFVRALSNRYAQLLIDSGWRAIQ